MGKNRARKRPSPQVRAARRLRKRAEKRGFEARRRPPGETKMSEVLLEFAEPLLDMLPDDIETTKQAISVAIVCWNLAVIPRQEERDELLRQFTEAVSLSKAEFHEMADWLIKRKHERFGGFQQLIMSYEFTFSGGDLRLLVASSPVADEA